MVCHQSHPVQPQLSGLKRKNERKRKKNKDMFEKIKINKSKRF